MQRPKSTYLAATWCTVALLFQVGQLSRIIRPYRETGETPPPWVAILPLFIFAFVIWEAYGLTRLRAFQRWFAVVFLSLWTVTLTWNFGLVLLAGSAHPVRILVAWLVIGSLNAAAVWCLCRRSFREFAAQYVGEQQREKHSRMMEKVSQKALAKELKSQ
jgi:hypothetical protein